MNKISRTVLCQIETHDLRRIGWVDDHKDRASSRVTCPVSRCDVSVSAIQNRKSPVILTRILEVVACVFSLIIDVCSERRNCLSLIWVLVDGNNLLVCQNLDGLSGRVAKISSNQEVRLEECPCCKVSLLQLSIFVDKNQVSGMSPSAHRTSNPQPVFPDHYCRLPAYPYLHVGRSWNKVNDAGYATIIKY